MVVVDVVAGGRAGGTQYFPPIPSPQPSTQHSTALPCPGAERWRSAPESGIARVILGRGHLCPGVSWPLIPAR